VRWFFWNAHSVVRYVVKDGKIVRYYGIAAGRNCRPLIRSTHYSPGFRGLCVGPCLPDPSAGWIYRPFRSIGREHVSDTF